MQCLTGSSLFSHLSIVITMRYWMSRLLLHRPVVTRFLNFKKEQGAFENSELLELFGGPHLKVGVRSASEMIDIIFSLSEHQHLMLTTWWFSIYYCKFAFISLFYRPYGIVDLSEVFSASLVVFSAMVLKHQHSTLLLCHEDLELPSTLLKAVKALERIGSGTRMVARCLKHLQKLADFAETFGMHLMPLNGCHSLHFDLTNFFFKGLGQCPCEVSPNVKNATGLALPLQFPDLLDFPGVDLDGGLSMFDAPWDGTFF